LEERSKKKILNGNDKKYLVYCSFYRYLTTIDPRNAVDVVVQLGKGRWENIKGGKILLKELSEEDKIQKQLKME